MPSVKWANSSAAFGTAIPSVDANAVSIGTCQRGLSRVSTFAQA